MSHDPVATALGSDTAFDTAPIIYFVEANPAYDALVTEIFRQVSAGQIEGWTSVISLSEVLVQPIVAGRKDLQQQYRELLLRSSHFQTAAISSTVAESAAHIRASCGLRLPDALQIASAVENGCEAFVCNDRAMLRVKELRILVLDDLEI